MSPSSLCAERPETPRKCHSSASAVSFVSLPLGPSLDDAFDCAVSGVTDYGVLQKGDDKPFRLVYYPKATFGSAGAKSVGTRLGLEVVAEPGLTKARFQVLAVGEPVAESEVTVMLPAGGKKGVKTDKDGNTPTFEGAGRHGVHTKQIDPKESEHAGKKYSETRSYATLVCDVAK